MKTLNKNLVLNSTDVMDIPSKKSNTILYKKIITLSIMLFSSLGIFAGTVDAQIDTWKTTVKDSLDAAVFVFAIVGAFLIFVQYMQGNEQAQKNLIRFVIGLAVFGLADLIAGAFLTP